MTADVKALPHGAGSAELVVVGESIVDVITGPGQPEPVLKPGGSPLNVSVGAARLEVPTTLLTFIGNDDEGRIIRQHVEGNGVGLVQLGDAEDPSSRALATLDGTGAASYQFDVFWDVSDVDAAGARAITAAGHVHAGSIAAVLAPGRELTLSMAAAAREHATVTFDPNCRPALGTSVTETRLWVEEFVRLSDLVKASDEDVAWLYPGLSPDEVADQWLDGGAAVVVITRGGAGPRASTSRFTVEIPAVTVDVMDTVGAGDSFMAALLAWMRERGFWGRDGRQILDAVTASELEAGLAFAARAAAITCSREGANPPTRAEMAQAGR
jgi:fructokinase